MKQIPLDDEQYKVLREDRRASTNVSYVLADMVLELADRMSEKEGRFWSSVAELAGVEKNETERLKIDWVNRCIFVKDKKDKAETR